MAYFCWACAKELYFALKAGIVVGRHDDCPHCGADLKCCKNCKSYDPAVHGSCTEPTAEFIRDRERANFCAHFDFRDRDAPVRQDPGDAARDKLEALFKSLK